MLRLDRKKKNLLENGLLKFFRIFRPPDFFSKSTKNLFFVGGQTFFVDANLDQVQQLFMLILSRLIFRIRVICNLQIRAGFIEPKP